MQDRLQVSRFFVWQGVSYFKKKAESKIQGHFKETTYAFKQKNQRFLIFVRQKNLPVCQASLPKLLKDSDG